MLPMLFTLASLNWPAQSKFVPSKAAALKTRKLRDLAGGGERNHTPRRYQKQFCCHGKRPVGQQPASSAWHTQAASCRSLHFHPLVLVDAHTMLVTHVSAGKPREHWKQPEVWKDLKAVFEKFFKPCADANGTRQR